MSDIEKRKELSEEEEVMNDSFEKERYNVEKEKSVEEESSQTADPGSVADKKLKPEEEPDADFPDTEIAHSDTDKDSPSDNYSPEEPENKKETEKISEEQELKKSPASETSLTDKPPEKQIDAVEKEKEPASTKQESVEEQEEIIQEEKEPYPGSDLKEEFDEIRSKEASFSEEESTSEETVKSEIIPEEPSHSGKEPDVTKYEEEEQQDNLPSSDKDQGIVEEDQPPHDKDRITAGEEPPLSDDTADKVQLTSGKDQGIPGEDPPSAGIIAGGKYPPTEAMADDENHPAPGKDQDSDDEGPEEDKEEVHGEDEEKDYSTFSKEEIIHEIELVLKGEDMKKIERLVKELKSFYDELYEKEKKGSLQKFLDEGGAEVDFEYAGDALDSRLASIYDNYKIRRNNYYTSLDKEKDINLQKKHDVLEKLRSLVDGEETTTSIGALKEIQKEWKEIGPVPGQYAKSLWATYNILIDRFYDNRSIYFELKELDRKKNLEGKLELCKRAEELAESNNVKEAVKELNELHEEFKHIGPVPKEVQEEIWQRFKGASDAIYAKRKEFVGRLKKDLNENLKLKQDFVDAVETFKDFDSDKISDWNEKTREILEIQKKWESVGGLPREHAKEINKSFWSNFKSFFNNKNRFFKKLEGQRDENLLKKEELVKKAEELQQSEDWDKTAESLKELQKEWKNIGPVPEKSRNDVYKRFKAACDNFFERRRSHSKDLEGDYRENLKKKEEICEEIEKMVDKANLDTDRLKKLQMEFDKIGYVPRNAIRKIQKKYDAAVSRFLEAADLPGAEKSELKFTIEINRLKSSPNSDQKIQRKENELRRMIGKLENDIALWRNNLEFFAESKTADKLREEFSKKISEASDQLDELKEELKVLNKID